MDILVPLLSILFMFGVGYWLGRREEQANTQVSGPDSVNIQSPHSITVVLRDAPRDAEDA